MSERSHDLISDQFKSAVASAGSRLALNHTKNTLKSDSFSKTLSFEDLLQKACALQDIGRLEEAASVLEEANKMMAKIEMSSQFSDDKFDASFNDLVGAIEEDKLSISSNLSDDTFNLLKSDNLSDHGDYIGKPVPEMKQSFYESPKSIKKAASVKTPVVQSHKPAKANVSPTLSPKPCKPPQTKNISKESKAKSTSALDDFLLKDVNVTTTPLQSVNRQLMEQNKPAEETAYIAGHQNQATARRTVTKAGYLLVSARRGIFSSWKKKYVILTGRLVLIFKSAKETKCESVIDLYKAIVEAVRMQVKNKKQVKSVYEFRLQQRDKNYVFRFRYATKSNKFDDDEQKNHISRWASNVKNNILICSKNLDVQKDELESLLELHKKGQKHENSEDSATHQLDDIGSSIKLFNTGKRNKVKGKDNDEKSWRVIEQESEIDKARKEKHFTTRNRVSQFSIGANIGSTSNDENIFVNYKLLNIPVNSSANEIKKAYRSLARDYHPDKNINNLAKEERTRRFAAISQAFSVLKFKETRASYDLCENVKALLRKGIVVRLHRIEENPKQQLLFIDKNFLNLYMQDIEYGTVLHKGYRTIELRFVTHIYRGVDGFVLANRDIETTESDSTFFPSGDASCFLTLHGDRIGEQDWHIQTANKQSRDELLEGLRKLRCDNSELFKQRLDEMINQGLT